MIRLCPACSMEAHDSYEPPLEQVVSSMISKIFSPEISKNHQTSPVESLAFEEQGYTKFTDLPVIDISRLGLEEGLPERKECEREIVEAARDWGFFQLVNHGIPGDVLERMKWEEKEVFRQPFEVKRAGGGKLLDLGAETYRWGNPKASCLRHVSWSEAFHIATTDISRIEDEAFRSAVEIFAAVATGLTEKIAEILAVNLGADVTYFRENCTKGSCYLRLNRYPPCPFSSEVFGLVPHTDSDFLTIVCQDRVGGLQLMKGDGSWVNVSPNPDALVINIGDLLQGGLVARSEFSKIDCDPTQAWSNGVYKSVKHRVMASPEEERLSMAFFYCPRGDTVIRSCINPSIYRKFSFREYKLQVQKDVQVTGDKVGLSRFLL